MTCIQRENDQRISGRSAGLKTICIYSISLTSGLNRALLKETNGFVLFCEIHMCCEIIAPLFTVCENKEIVKTDDIFIIRV